MIEIWMRNHLVSDNNCNTINLQSPQLFLQVMTNNVGPTINVDDTTPWFTMSMEQDD